MDTLQLKELIISDTLNIERILESIGCAKIKYFSNRTQIRCAYNESTNGTSIAIDLHTLNVKSFSSEFTCVGDIITLVSQKMDLNFNNSVKHICNVLGIECDIKQRKIELPFGGYYHNIKQNNNQFMFEQDCYSEEILKQFIHKPNIRFLKDNINLETQKKFKIGYDPLTNRISIPWKIFNGVAGVMGRYNGDDYEQRELAKYLPLVNFSKSNYIYGLSENYSNLIGGIVCITESEKSVLQADSMGINNVIAVGSHNISNTQAQTIKSLFPKIVLICYDEGIDDIDFLKKECEKLNYINSFTRTKVGFVLDKDNKYLLKGSKKSPTDLGIEVFKKLLIECVRWI